MCFTLHVLWHAVLCCAGHINPDVAIESYTMNITTVQGFDAFKASVTEKDDPSKSRVDLILSCVDNYEARITINQVGWLHM
jgi:ubiquitin-like modifier-activating enzyme 5